MGVSDTPVSNPIDCTSFLKYSVFDHNFSTCSGSVSRTSMDALQAAIVAGGAEPDNSIVLDLLNA